MAVEDARDPVAAAARTVRRQPALWLPLLGATVLALIAAVAWLQWRQSSLMSLAMLSGGDNLVRSLYQADYEYLRLRQVWPQAPGAVATEVDLDALQLRYDIYVSRIGLLRNAARANAIGSRADVRAALREADAFIAAADRVLGSGRQPADRGELLGLQAALLALEAPMRGLTLGAGEVVSESGTRLAAAGRLHNRLGIAATLLLAALAAVFAAFALRQLARERDRSEQLEDLAAALKAARTAAEQASAAKSSFLANMSHEIRTPFMGLQGMLRLLGDTSLDERQARYLRTASASARHLLTLLDDILDASRLEAGQMTIEAVPMDLSTLLSDIEALMRPVAEGKGLRLGIEVHPKLPAHVLADPTRLRQVLFNLMSNAIKFTERGSVRLLVHPLDGAAPAAHESPQPWCFTVADTGIGIDAGTQARLFQRFSQGDDSRSRRFGGTGLGLEISRALARRMGGDITVSSVPGEGSRFTFRVPLALPHDPDTGMAASVGASAAQRPPPRLRVLVAEDNEVNRLVLDAMLSGLGQQAAFAVDGNQAVELAASQDWDIVLMDLHMPELDGLSAARAIRALPERRRAAVPIVALTADVFPETRERCSAAGIVDFLTKPVDPGELAASLARRGTAWADSDWQEQPVAG